MRDAVVEVPNGRVLAYTEFGSPTGPLVVDCHGAPGSRLELASFDGAFAERDVRVVTIDRPGYGGSSPQPDRRLENWPADAAAVADDLGADRFAVTGFTTGGEYAVACAALLPDRPPRSAPRCAKKAMRPCRGSCAALRCTTSWIRPSRGEVACS